MSIAIVTESQSEEMREVRVGIIGCGGIANGKHMPSLHKLPNVKMVAFCDLIPSGRRTPRPSTAPPTPRPTPTTTTCWPGTTLRWCTCSPPTAPTRRSPSPR